MVPRLLKDKKLKIYAPDFRGYGHSSYKNKLESVDDLAKDIELFCRELNISKASFFGESLGGPVALSIGYLFP